MPRPSSPPMNGDRVLADLRELRELTSTPAGAQRVAWGPVWCRAREWFRGRVAELGLEVVADAAGNGWVTLPGSSQGSLVLGGHLDSVPNGGWLDGCLGMLASLEALRCYSQVPPILTLQLVDWADEEGARVGRSLLGSSAAAGSLDPAVAAALRDRDGLTLAEALEENDVDPRRMLEAHDQLLARHPRAYLELHIEQGPVLESLGCPAGAVVGTFGVERHRVRFVGQAAHSGSTPMALRRDALLAAAELALEVRRLAVEYSGTTPETRVVGTCGELRLEPGVATAVPGVSELAVDQRALDPEVLGQMLAATRAVSERVAEANRLKVEWRPLWRIEPRLFAPEIVELAGEALTEVTGQAPRLPSGPLHDAAEMAPLMPTAMLFAASRRGLSHCKEEDTPEDDLRLAVAAYVSLVDKTLRHFG